MSMRLRPYVRDQPRYDVEIREELLRWLFHSDRGMFIDVFAKSLEILNHLRPIYLFSNTEPIARSDSPDFPRDCTLHRLYRVFRLIGTGGEWGTETPYRILHADATGTIGFATRLVAEAR